MNDGHLNAAHQAMWDIYRVLGFDTDGDASPAATLAGMGPERFCQMMVGAAVEFRQDYDEALEANPKAVGRNRLRHARKAKRQADERVIALVAERDALQAELDEMIS